MRQRGHTTDDVTDPCQRVLEAVREGREPEPGLRGHVDGCSSCAALVAAAPSLVAAAASGADEASGLDAVWAALDDDLRHEQGLGGRVRSLPTATRVGLVATVAAVVPLLVALTWGRADLGVYPAGRLVLDVLALAIPASLLLVVAMRPVHRPAWPRWVPGLALALAVLGALLGAILEPAHAVHPASVGGTGSELFPRAVPCLVTGTVLGLPMLLILRLVLRRRGRYGLPFGLAVVLAGVTGALGIFLHCSLVAPQHLLAGHATVVAVFLALAGLAGTWRTSRARPDPS